MKKIGYLGLGIMGHGMTVNLIRESGEDIYGFDPVPEALKRFADAGGKPAQDAATLYETCDILFLCLPTNELVQRTVREIIATAKPGTVIADMSSTSPFIIRELYEEAKAKEIRLLDSPVSGGQTGAEDGTLTIMVGGDRDAFEEVKPYYEMMGKTVTYMGGSGCGDAAKVANNMMVGIHLVAMGEAFAFAKKAGLDPEVLFHAIKDGFAQSAVMDLKVPKVLARDFDASARIAVHYKDIHNAMDMAGHMGVELPLTKIVEEEMDYMNENGMINEDQCALVKYYENTMGVKIAS